MTVYQTAQNMVLPEDDKDEIAVSIVMPCLNEIGSLPHCITNAQDALLLILERYGLSGEVVIADNGSTDGSQELARSRGARAASSSRGACCSRWPWRCG